MITHTQYALLVGIPTGTIILGIVVRTLLYRRWLRIFREGMEHSNAQHMLALVRHKLWEGNRNNV